MRRVGIAASVAAIAFAGTGIVLVCRGDIGAAERCMALSFLALVATAVARWPRAEGADE